MSSSLGSLVVSLAANTAEFTSDLGKAAHNAAKNFEQIQASAKKMGEAVGANIAAAATAAVWLTKSAIDNADAMNKLAQSTGIEIKALSEYSYAARLANVENEALSVSIGKLNKNIYDAARGTGDAMYAFSGLGINVKDANGALKSADKVLLEVADKFKDMEDGAGKSALAMMMFGKSGAAIIPLLNGGAQAISEARDEAILLGASLDNEAGAAAERFNDNLTRLVAIKQGLANQIMKAVLPALTGFTDEMINSAKSTDGMATAARVAADGVRILLTAFVATAAGARVMGDSVAKLITFLKMPANSIEDFRKAFAFLGEDSSDMASVIEQSVKQIDAIWKETAKSSNTAVDIVRKNAAPIVATAESIAAAKAKEAAAMRAAAKEQEALQKLAADLEKQNAEAVFKQQEAARMLAEDAKQTAQDNLDQVRASLMDEREVLDDHYKKKLDQLQNARDQEIITQAEYDGLASSLAEKYQSDMAEIDARGWTERQKFDRLSLKDKAKTIFSELADITAGVAQNNRALFEINKVAGIANAIINAYEGISLTLSKYPYPLNIALAAAHGIAAFAQVKAIQGAQFGSGGNAPSLAGGTPATPVTPVTGGTPPNQGSGQTTIVQLSGADLYSDKAVRELLKRIKETTDKGGKLVIA